MYVHTHIRIYVQNVCIHTDKWNGQKFILASCSWLFSCATSGCKVPENAHSVCIKQSQQCNADDMAEKTMNVITPFRTLQPSLSTTVRMLATVIVDKSILWYMNYDM